MMQAIYGDLYFIVNFTMDSLALYLTAKLLRLPCTKWRLAIGGAVGALYSVLSLLLPDGNPFALFSSLLIPCLLCLVTFGWQNIRAFLRELTAFWVLSILLGGAVTAVCYAIGAWGKKQVSIGGSVQPLMGDLPFWGLLFIALLVAALGSLLLKARKPTARLTEITVEEASSVRLNALVDSGNLLTEPISGLPVIVIDRSHVSNILPDELHFLASPGNQHPRTVSRRLRLIPCTTASGESMLYGFIPKRLLVAGVPRNACIAVGQLPQNSDYAAIVPATLL